MPITCPVDLDTQVLRTEISNVYARVAADPAGDFHFHRGPAYAAAFLGYDPAELAALPAECTASFAGIGNPHAIAPIVKGETVLDIGCGAGTDLLLAARRVGPTGRAIGVDMTEAMRDRARTSAAASGLTPSRVATYTTTPELAETRSPGTRSRREASSADSSLDSPPIEEQRTELGVAPTPPAPHTRFVPAAPYRPHNGPAEHCRE